MILNENGSITFQPLQPHGLSIFNNIHSAKSIYFPVLAELNVKIWLWFEKCSEQQQKQRWNGMFKKGHVYNCTKTNHRLHPNCPLFSQMCTCTLPVMDIAMVETSSSQCLHQTNDGKCATGRRVENWDVHCHPSSYWCSSRSTYSTCVCWGPEVMKECL